MNDKRKGRIIATDDDSVPINETVKIIQETNSHCYVLPKDNPQDHEVQLIEAAERDARDVYDEANVIFKELGLDAKNPAVAKGVAVEYAEMTLEVNLCLIRKHMEQGKQFRKQFSRTAVADIARYITQNKIDAAWLIGFADDEALTRQVKRHLREMQRSRMSELAKRPRKRKSKWPQAVRDEAIACYREWIEAATSASDLWGTTWRAFSMLTIKRIRQKTGIKVPEDSLRRLILPAKRFPRPRHSH